MKPQRPQVNMTKGVENVRSSEEVLQKRNKLRFDVWGKIDALQMVMMTSTSTYS